MANQFKFLLVLAVVLAVGFVEIEGKKNDLEGLKSDLSDEEEEELLDEPDGDRGCIAGWNVDYIMLTVQWGPGVCNAGSLNCIRRPASEFKIHGLWPQSNSNRNLGFCCSPNSYFNKDHLDDSIYRGLRADWPSFTNIPEEVFWQHEWKKHGTCGNKMMEMKNSNDYFSLGLKMFKQLYLDSNLKAFKIRPSLNTAYDYFKLKNALTYSHRANIAFNCAPYADKMALTEVKFCFNTSLQPTDCPMSSWKCKDELFLLSA